MHPHPLRSSVTVFVLPPPMMEQRGTTQTYYSQGFPVGEMINSKYYVNNHVHLVVDYHPMVVGEVSG